MIDVEKLRKLKGRRIYQFWLDEETGDITDVTSRDDVIQVIYCKDCKYCEISNGYVIGRTFVSKDFVICNHPKTRRFETEYTGFCDRAERKEE